MHSKKLLHGLMAGVISLGIILAGAFAWISFTQTALNIFEGFTNPGVNIIDDYEDGKPNKDVYVENTGNRPLYVRVRFDEFMQINNQQVYGSGNTKTSIEDWDPHIYAGAAHYCASGYHSHYEWTMGGKTANTGDPDNGWKYYLSTPFANRALFDANGVQIREPKGVTYYSNPDRTLAKMYGYTSDPSSSPLDDSTWEASRQTAVEAYERIDLVLASDFLGSDADFNTYCTNENIENPKNIDYLNWLYETLGKAAPAQKAPIQAKMNTFLETNALGYWDLTYTVKESVDGTKDNYNFAESDLENPTVVFVPIKRTSSIGELKNGNPIKAYTMEEWILAGMPNGPFWIQDTDGWFYWAEILLPEQATGLLLSEVNLISSPDGVWYYGINARLEAVTFDDLNKFGSTGNSGITDQGLQVLQNASGQYVFDMKSGEVGPSDPIYTFFDHKDGVYRQMFYGSTTGITYGPRFVYTSDPAGKTMGDIYALADASPVGGEYAIDTEFQKNVLRDGTAVAVTFKVVVVNDILGGSTGSPIYEASNGKHYIKLEYNDGKGTEDAVAWLAVGQNGKFDALTGSAPKLSSGDDILIWTSEDYPGTTADRAQEAPSASTVKIGDIYNIDDIDWLVIAMNTTGGSETTTIISLDVLEENVASGNVTTKLAEYADGTNGTPENYKLENLIDADGDITATLLTVQQAMEYFANQADRVAESGKWWLTGDVIIGENGAFLPANNQADDVGLRVAVVIDTTEFDTIAKAAANP